MHLLPCSLFLLLATAINCAHSFKCINNTVTCVRRPGAMCLRPPAASQCCSGKVVQCGYCTVCLVYLEKGGQCESFAETNAVCHPPLTCKGYVCA